MQLKKRQREHIWTGNFYTGPDEFWSLSITVIDGKDQSSDKV